jgi:hypothetical protein
MKSDKTHEKTATLSQSWPKANESTKIPTSGTEILEMFKETRARIKNMSYNKTINI